MLLCIWLQRAVVYIYQLRLLDAVTSRSCFFNYGFRCTIILKQFPSFFKMLAYSFLPLTYLLNKNNQEHCIKINLFADSFVRMSPHSCDVQRI
uniref:Putative secreted protein n=1 Tax=Ixodes ricinus TaxID=34613 RepID=A0A6B0UDB1_IXORI